MKDISFIRGKCTRLCDTALTVKAKNRFLRDFPWMCFRSCDSVGPVHESVNQSGPNGGMAETDLWATQREEQEGDGRLQALRTSHRTGVWTEKDRGALPSMSSNWPPLNFQSVWVKKGAMQWWRDWKPHKWIDVQFAFEQFSGPDGNKDGILFIYYNYNEEKKVRDDYRCIEIPEFWSQTPSALQKLS